MRGYSLLLAQPVVKPFHEGTGTDEHNNKHKQIHLAILRGANAIYVQPASNDGYVSLDRCQVTQYSFQLHVH